MRFAAGRKGGTMRFALHRTRIADGTVAIAIALQMRLRGWGISDRCKWLMPFAPPAQHGQPCAACAAGAEDFAFC